MIKKPIHLNPYAISAALVAVMLYLGLVVHVFLLAPDVIGHEEKGFALIILVLLPGKYLMDFALRTTAFNQSTKDRINWMLFMGCALGWSKIETTTGFGDTGTAFLYGFGLGAIGVWLLDVALDKIKACWKTHKSSSP